MKSRKEKLLNKADIAKGDKNLKGLKWEGCNKKEHDESENRKG